MVEVAVGGTLVLALVIMAVMYMIRKRAKVIEEVVSEYFLL
jgi:hypothetical protein